MTRHIGTKHYVGVWAGLLVLTALSLAASRAELGSIDIVISLGIATAKGVLVGLFFMHLLEERASTVFVPIVAVALVVLLVGLTALDVTTRRTFPSTPDPGLVPPREFPP